MTTTDQRWIFSVRYAHADHSLDDYIFSRRAVVGPADAATVEAALQLAQVPEAVRAEIRASQIVRDFVDGKLDYGGYGYMVDSPVGSSWHACIGPVHEVIDR